MRMKISGSEEYFMKIWGAGEHKVCSYDDSLSEYAPLIGWNVRLIQVLVCDWLKLRRNLRGNWKHRHFDIITNWFIIFIMTWNVGSHFSNKSCSEIWKIRAARLKYCLAFFAGSKQSLTLLRLPPGRFLYRQTYSALLKLRRDKDPLISCGDFTWLWLNGQSERIDKMI